MATSTKPKSARERALQSLKRRKNGASARQLGEMLTSGKDPAIVGKYALANARKVIYSMVASGELDRDEEGICTISEG